LLVGDETALPAIARWLRELPADAEAVAVVEVADAADEQPLPSPARTTVRWLHRDGDAAPGAYRLADAVRAGVLPPPRRYAWGAGEASCVQAVRRVLVDERGIDPRDLSARGYWKRGTADHQEPHDD